MAATELAYFHQPQVQNIWTFCGCTPPAPAPPLWCRCSPPCAASGPGAAHRQRIPSRPEYSTEPAHNVSAQEYTVALNLCTCVTHLFLLKEKKLNTFFRCSESRFIEILIRIKHFKWIRIRIRSRVLMTKSRREKTAEFFFFFIKNCKKGRPSYRRSLQSSKENNQHFKRWNLSIVFNIPGPFLPF